MLQLGASQRPREEQPEEPSVSQLFRDFRGYAPLCLDAIGGIAHASGELARGLQELAGVGLCRGHLSSCMADV